MVYFIEVCCKVAEGKTCCALEPSEEHKCSGGLDKKERSCCSHNETDVSPCILLTVSKKLILAEEVDMTSDTSDNMSPNITFKAHCCPDDRASGDKVGSAEFVRFVPPYLGSRTGLDCDGNLNAIVKASCVAVCKPLDYATVVSE